MLIKSSVLKGQLNKGFLPIIYLQGEETLLIEDSRKTCLSWLKNQGFDETIILHVDAGFNWSELTQHLDSLSLFSNKKVIELRMPTSKPGAKGAEIINSFLNSSPSEDIVLLIISEKVDASIKRSAWYKAVDKKGLIVEHSKIYSNQLTAWILQRSKLYQLNLHSDASESLAYFFEGNLLSIDQVLKQLNLLYNQKQIRAEDIQSIVSDSSRFDTFSLADSCLKGDLKSSLHILNSLIREKAEPVLINWVLQKEIRSLLNIALNLQQNKSIEASFKELRIWQSRKKIVQQALARLSLGQLFALHQRSMEIDHIIKGVNSDYRQGQFRESFLWHQFEKLITLFSQSTRVSTR